MECNGKAVSRSPARPTVCTGDTTSDASHTTKQEAVTPALVVAYLQLHPQYETLTPYVLGLPSRASNSCVLTPASRSLAAAPASLRSNTAIWCACSCAFFSPSLVMNSSGSIPTRQPMLIPTKEPIHRHTVPALRLRLVGDCIHAAKPSGSSVVARTFDATQLALRAAQCGLLDPNLLRSRLDAT
jgi:hypothetical protein